MSFGPEFENRERVRQSTDIVELVSRYVSLRRQGRHHVGLCPFHDDRTPSLQVNVDRQTWKCWVCNVGGDVFSFVMHREGLSFPEALQLLADRAGITLEKTARSSRKETIRADDKALLYRAMNWATEQFHQYLQNDTDAKQARDYIIERQIEMPTVDRFQIGYAPDHWSWLVDLARTTPYRPEILEACGLVERKADTGRYYDRFRGRLLFPIRDTQHRTVAFGGRVLPASAEAYEAKFGRPAAKYINSKETSLYTKSDHLYGLDVVRDSVAKTRQIIIVEGYTDVVLTWQAGVDNVAAVLGTALNERHLRLIKRFADQVVLVLDGDAAGQKRANEVLDLFVAADIDLRILTLPEGLDPCDFILQRDVSSFLDAVQQAPDALEHKITQEIAGVDLVHDTHRASQALNALLGSIAKAPRLEIRNLSASRLREQAILGKLSRRFHVGEDVIRTRLAEIREQNTRRSRPSSSDSPERRPIEATPPTEKHESELIEILLVDSQRSDRIIENISPDQFVLGPMRDIYELICHCYHSGLNIEFDQLMSASEDPAQKSLLVTLVEKGHAKQQAKAIDTNAWLDDVLTVFHRMEHETERQQVIDQLESHQLSEEEEKDALAKIMAMKQAEQQSRMK